MKGAPSEPFGPGEGAECPRVTRLYGLVVRSAVPLHHDRPPRPGAPVDLDIVVGERVAASTEPPPGRILLDMRTDSQHYTGTTCADGFRLRFYGTCDVAVDAALRRASVHLFPGADPAILPVLVGGAVLAFVLALRGDTVLHGSAVQVGRQALAFVGASGMGKSTMATLLCADGGRLITDDLLRLDVATTPPTCALGSTELRLRKSTGELSARFKSAPGHRITGDERYALAVESAQIEDVPLAAIVVPAPDHSPDTTQVVTQRLDPMTSFLLLSRFPRLLGWVDEEVLRRGFQQLGDVVEKVPVFVARLPWGPPFQEDLAAEVRRAVGMG